MSARACDPRGASELGNGLLGRAVGRLQIGQQCDDPDRATGIAAFAVNGQALLDQRPGGERLAVLEDRLAEIAQEDREDEIARTGTSPLLETRPIAKAGRRAERRAVVDGYREFQAGSGGRVSCALQVVGQDFAGTGRCRPGRQPNAGTGESRARCTAPGPATASRRPTGRGPGPTCRPRPRADRVRRPRPRPWPPRREPCWCRRHRPSAGRPRWSREKRPTPQGSLEAPRPSGGATLVAHRVRSIRRPLAQQRMPEGEFVVAGLLVQDARDRRRPDRLVELIAGQIGHLLHEVQAQVTIADRRRLDQAHGHQAAARPAECVRRSDASRAAGHRRRQPTPRQRKGSRRRASRCPPGQPHRLRRPYRRAGVARRRARAGPGAASRPPAAAPAALSRGSPRAPVRSEQDRPCARSPRRAADGRDWCAARRRAGRG